jgi:hypothetical protein
MERFATLAGFGITLAVLAGCAVPERAPVPTLSKGEQLNIRYILGAHPGQRACVEYRAATESCASIITASFEGDTLISREIAALQVAGSTSVQNIEVVTRSTLTGDRACSRPEDISVTGRDEMSEFMLGAARELIGQLGGSICTTYYRSGDGYVATTVGANGQPVPTGDIKFQFISGEAGLRAQ